MRGTNSYLFTDSHSPNYLGQCIASSWAVFAHHLSQLTSDCPISVPSRTPWQSKVVLLTAPTLFIITPPHFLPCRPPSIPALGPCITAAATSPSLLFSTPPLPSIPVVSIPFRALAPGYLTDHTCLSYLAVSTLLNILALACGLVAIGTRERKTPRGKEHSLSPQPAPDTPKAMRPWLSSWSSCMTDTCHRTDAIQAILSRAASPQSVAGPPMPCREGFGTGLTGPSRVTAKGEKLLLSDLLFTSPSSSVDQCPHACTPSPTYLCCPNASTS
ncbi:hypothetical protein LZ30DRAFT_400730 [Colletotrichum cereale]|nr:hypothetical protein LZ30DRAFT_400730 [Colletotrichum cereale]